MPARFAKRSYRLNDLKGRKYWITSIKKLYKKTPIAIKMRSF